MISDAVAIAGIGAMTTIVTLVVTHFLNKIDKKVGVIAEKQEEVHKQIDGKMEKLLEVTGAKERAEGINEGIAQKQGEVDELNKASNLPKRE